MVVKKWLAIMLSVMLISANTVEVSHASDYSWQDYEGQISDEISSNEDNADSIPEEESYEEEISETEQIGNNASDVLSGSDISQDAIDTIEASDNIEVTPPAEGSGEQEITEINPLYRDIIDESDLVEPQDINEEEQSKEAESYSIDTHQDASIIYDNSLGEMIVNYPDGTSVNVETETVAATRLGSVYFQGIEYCSHIAEAEAILREGFASRKSVITTYYKTSSSEDYEDLYQALKAGIFAHTGNPMEGDYIKWQYSGWRSYANYYQDASSKYYTITWYPTYFTTIEQENEVSAAVKAAIDETGATHASSEYKSVKKLYDYICSNITYDHAGLNNNDTLCHSAYAAIIKKTAVCQGYALLFYRMALELGIDARLIAGWGTVGDSSSGHAWNIVEINGSYYNLDSTWDAGQSKYQFFLKCNSTFQLNNTRHQRWGSDTYGNVYEYDTPEFEAAYPMSDTDYQTPDSTEIPDEPGEANNISIANATVTILNNDFTFTGHEIEPELVVIVDDKDLKENDDYTVSYYDNINAGTARIRIDGTGDYYGYQNVTFQINKRDINDVTNLGISDTEYKYVIPDGDTDYIAIIYQGEAVKPSIDASLVNYQLSEGTDYTLSYSNNNKIGTASVTVTGIDNFKGSTMRQFRIITESQPINISSNKTTITRGDTCTVKVTGNTGHVTYQSSNPAIAKVDANTGVVTGVSAGTAMITAIAAAEYSLYEGIASGRVAASPTD